MDDSTLIRNDHGQKIAALETSVKSLHGELGEIKAAVSSIATTLQNTRETNWATIFAGVAVLVSVIAALWAAAINPLNHDLDRLASEKEKLAEAVLVQNNKMQDLKDQVVELKSFNKFQFQSK
jgi:prefoldin subunit 5